MNSIGYNPPIYSYVSIPIDTVVPPIPIDGHIGSILTTPMSSYLRNLVNGSQQLNANARLVFDTFLMFSCTANITTANGRVSYYISTDYSDGNASHSLSSSIIPLGNATHYTVSSKIPVLIADIVHSANTLFKINVVNEMTSSQHGDDLVFVGANTFVNIAYLPMGYTV